MKKMDKKAFTLIELIVVIAVIGILVLLGIPRFTGHKDKVELTRIQHDVKVMEQEIGKEFINNDDDFNSWGDNNKDFNQLIQEGKLFEKEGVAYEEPIDGPYKVIPEKYKDKTNTKLKGTFYANNDGKVYYEHAKPLAGIPSEPGEEGPEYSDEEIQDLIEKHNFIPVATADDLNSVRSEEKRIYAAGTKWATKNEVEGGLNKQYVQVANINLSEYPEEGWSPIGTSSEPFTGTYDGGNYVITGLEVKGEGKDYQGLFGYTKEATISNVGLIANKVTGREYVGGLVGHASASTISNSYATGEVIGTERVGGLVGFAVFGVNINSSYATGLVNGGSLVGGLMGWASTRTKIINSYSTGDVTGSGNYVGGLVGRANSTDGPVISNSYATGSVTSTGKYVGGLVGWAARASKISNSYATGPVTGSENVGGLVGLANESIIENSYWDTETTGQSTSAGQDDSFGKPTVEMMKQATYSGWDFVDVWKIDEGNDYPKLR